MKFGDVEEMLVAAARVGPWPVQALRELLQQVGATGYQLRQAVTSATGSGDLAVLHVKFWVHPTFTKDQWRFPLYVEGHGREDLIARVDLRSRQPLPASDTTDDLMQGEDADRLAREAYFQEQKGP